MQQRPFEARHQTLLGEDPQAAEDRDEYLADNVFWVPREARWSHLQAHARQSAIKANLEQLGFEDDEHG